MPLIQLFTSSAPSPEQVRTLLRQLSTTLAHELEKPESYVMTQLVPRAVMTFGGSDAPACYAVIKNIGTFTPDLTARLSATLSDLLSASLELPKTRIYLEFQEASPHLWGFAGETFA